MLGVTFSTHFQQLEDLKFQFFAGPPNPLKALCLRNLQPATHSNIDYLVLVLDVCTPHEKFCYGSALDIKTWLLLSEELQINLILDCESFVSPFLFR